MSESVNDNERGGGTPLHEDALIGLISWLAALDDSAHPRTLAEEATIIMPDWTVANGFQIGYLPQFGPFLAYPGVLWWFPHVWQTAAAGPAGMALIVHNPQPLALILRSHWPTTLAEFADLCSERGSLALYPFSEHYLMQWSAPNHAPRPISETVDVDPKRGALLPFPLESFAWLNPVLRYPWPV